jgi:hypothetical protein
MRSITFALVLAAGCTGSHDHGHRSGGGPLGHPADWHLEDAGPPIHEPPPGVAVCGGHVCRDGEECCILTATCVAIGDPSCAVPAGTTDPRACARASDCAAGELCDQVEVNDSPSCGGAVGTCNPESECGWSVGAFCGCDGRTYWGEDAVCNARRAGVRIATPRPCGGELHLGARFHACTSDADCDEHLDHTHCDVAAGWCVAEDPLIVCGVDAQCPQGQRCCGLTGLCFDPATDPETCTVPPPGSFFACDDQRDCDRWTGAWWGDGTPFLACEPVDCSGVGACFHGHAAAECEVVEPVCGCDGTTYTNRCGAVGAGVGVAHEGPC